MPTKKTKKKTVKKKKKVTSTVKKTATKKATTKKKTPAKKIGSKKVVKKEDIKYKIYDQEAEIDYKPTKKKEKKKDITPSFERGSEPTTEYHFVKETDEPEIRKSEPIITSDKPNKKDTSKKIVKKEEVKSKIEVWFSNITSSLNKKKKVTSVKKKTKTKAIPKKTKKTKKVDIDDVEVVKPLPENKVLRVLVIIHRNLHILFNTLLIITFIILILGLKRVLVIPDSTIKYIAMITGFLCIIAISLNKYISGRLFSMLILAGMITGIYYLNYTYDFINNYNTKLYEYQNYYVVALDNGRNKSIYTINNKKVGLISENSKNVERVLNTKLDNVKYKEYQIQDDLYKDFYDGQYRAIIVKENQYKYLENNNIKPGTKIKKLYEFKVNTKKDGKK